MLFVFVSSQVIMIQPSVAQTVSGNDTQQGANQTISGNDAGQVAPFGNYTEGYGMNHFGNVTNGYMMHRFGNMTGGYGMSSNGNVTNYMKVIPPTPSPEQQVKLGIPPNAVSCPSGYGLVINSFDSRPACISSSDITKFIARGWGHISST